MPNLITISHVSGQKPQASFDKNLLKLHTKVSSHYLYSDEQNWRLVTFVYKHTTSTKRIFAPFDGTFIQTVSCSIRPNMNNGEVYQLHKITISGGKTKPVISIKRSEITNASSMDLTLGGASQLTYANWDSYMYSPYASNADILAAFTLNNVGGVYGGNPSLPDWVKTSNITFASNESGSVIFELGSQAMSNMAFGLGVVNGNGVTNVGMVFLGGSLKPNVYGDVPNINASLTSQNLCKIEKIGSTEFKLYVNGTLFHTIPNLYPNQSWTLNSRPAGASQSDGILSAYKEN